MRGELPTQDVPAGEPTQNAMRLIDDWEALISRPPSGSPRVPGRNRSRARSRSRARNRSRPPYRRRWSESDDARGFAAMCMMLVAGYPAVRSSDVLHVIIEEAGQRAESVAEYLPLGESVRRLAQHERSTRGWTVRAVGVAELANDLRPVL
jgi:hypothetical protein